MKSTMLWRFLIVLALLTGIVTAAGAAGEPPVNVLFVGHYISRDFEPWWPKFQAAGAREGVRMYILADDPQRGLGYSLYTAELLRKFQVVVYSGLPDVAATASQAEKAEVAAFRERLDAYHRAGGGVLWVPMSFQHWGTLWSQVVGERYDVQSLEEALYDPPKQVDVNPALNNPVYRYIWTTNVAPHPVTEGVRGLLLPLTGEWSWPGTVPMVFGKSWTVLVRGMDSTVTMGNRQPTGSGKQEFSPEVKGRYAGAPELVGVRDSRDGAGRMMVFPFHSTHTWRNFNHFAFHDAMMLKGDGVHPSDGLRLLLNGCKWLAAPATKAGLGGYAPPAQSSRASLAPLDWTQATWEASSWSGRGGWWDDVKQRDMPMSLETPGARDWKGLIGARTAASDGEGTVAEWVAAARQAGLSYLVFLENLEKCDDARYAKLVADCAAQTTADFAAIPGYLYRDLGGNLHYAYFVNKLPLAEFMTPERRVKSPNMIVDQNGWSNGQGLAELGKLKVDLAYLFLFSAVAPYVYENGKLVDDGLAAYVYSEGLGHQYVPMSLVITKRPADLAAAAAAAHLTVVHAVQLDDLAACFNREAQHPHRVYLSNGPVLTRWGALNPLGHPFWPGKERVRFGLEAEYSGGIAEVKILDANSGTVFRQFRPNGAKTFSVVIDEEHKHQWYLVPVVTGVDGRTAVGAGLVTYQDGNRTWMMSDRLMGMEHGMGWDEARQKLMKFGGWIGHPWTKPYLAGGMYPPNPRANELQIQGIDGGAVHSAAIDLNPAVVTDAGTEPKVPGFRFRDALASFDYGVMDFRGDAQFLVNKRTGATGWWETPDPQAPNEIADIFCRTRAVRGRYLAPVAANIHEFTVTFKRAVRLEQIRLGGMRSGSERVDPLVLIKDRGGEFAWLVGSGDNFNRKGVLDAGGYLYPSNYRGGAVGIINLGPTPIDYACQGERSQLFVAGGREVKAGETIAIRFLTFMRPWGDQTNNQWLQQFLADFGVGAERPGYPFTLRQGQLLSTNYVMELQAEGGGVTLEIGKYRLPHNLLVQAQGLGANAVAGRYDLERRQLLILPVFEGSATTSVNTTRGDTRLYVGELFHCDNAEVRLSCVQAGADALGLEIHNPTATPQAVTLAAVAGFTPLAGLSETLTVPPFSSVNKTYPTAPDTVRATPYEGD
ncbi:MAG TPA: hypothetical protein VGM19_00400 [Armatimonadota bacterium]|jgi:hypothetical protein